MPYLFTCPHCQTKTLVEDRYSGQSGRCVTCSSAISLPDFAPQPATPSGSPRGTTVSFKRAGGVSPKNRRVIAAAVCLAMILCAAVVIVRYGSPAVSTMQTNRLRAQSIRNIERIASALNAYAADHGTYPPPYIADSNGVPMHSWRVLILPYLGEQDLYDQYDMTKPWDSSVNQVLIGNIPAVYRPSSSAAFAAEAGYSLITGPGTLFPPAPPRGITALGPGDVIDDPGQTLLVVQSLPAPNTFASWTAPTDLDVTLMQGTIGGASGREIGGDLPGGAIVATVDGRGHFLDERAPRATVIALITIAGGEPLSDDVLDR